MTDTQHNKVNQKGNGMSAVVAGVAGIIAGGVAVATAVAMSDKNNQKKVSGALHDAKDKVATYIEDAKEKPSVKAGVKKIDEVKKDIKEKVEDKV